MRTTSMIRQFIFIPLLTGLFAASASAQNGKSADTCQPTGTLAPITGVLEASGLAISRKQPGRFWTHNDSGKPVLVGIDAKGAVTQRVELTGAKVADWEAVAVGPCAGGSCIYVGDIGDNAGKRKSISVYRAAEPAAGTQSVALTDVFHATYPDGGHDAEALLVGPDARIYIVTKGDTGPIAVYRFPADVKPGATVQLERVGKTINLGKGPDESKVTDGAMSPDGQWTVLRTRASIVFYRTADFTSGNFREHQRVDLKPLGEAQGEGVALSSDGVIYVASEGGGKQQPGSFAHFNCRPKP
jgi:hypothetical protein